MQANQAQENLGMMCVCAGSADPAPPGPHDPSNPIADLSHPVLPLLSVLNLPALVVHPTITGASGKASAFQLVHPGLVLSHKAFYTLVECIFPQFRPSIRLAFKETRYE